MVSMSSQPLDIIVRVAFPAFKFHVSEVAWEEAVLDSVAAAVFADKGIDTIEVKIQQYEDCTWVFESGMPIQNYDVTVFDDGSWRDGAGDREDNAECGNDLQSLFEFLKRAGRLQPSRRVEEEE